MKEIVALACVLACACGGTHKGAGLGSQALYAKTMRVGWGIRPSETGTTFDVFLQTLDEDGGQKSYPLGAYPGPCKVIAPAAVMKAKTGVACAGVELHAVIGQSEVVVLKLDTSGGGAPDPMARIEIARVVAPAGAAMEGAQ